MSAHPDVNYPNWMTMIGFDGAMTREVHVDSSGAVKALAPGWTPKMIGALDNVPQVVKTSAGRLSAIECINTDTSNAVYVVVYATATPVVGTTPYVWYWKVPPDQGWAQTYPDGGISPAGTGISLIATNNLTTLTAPAVPIDVNLLYS